MRAPFSYPCGDPGSNPGLGTKEDMYYDDKWLKEKFDKANISRVSQFENIRDVYQKQHEELAEKGIQLNVNQRLSYAETNISILEQKQDDLFKSLLEALEQIRILQDQNDKLVELVKSLTPKKPEATPVPGNGRKIRT